MRATLCLYDEVYRGGVPSSEGHSILRERENCDLMPWHKTSTKRRTRVRAHGVLPSALRGSNVLANANNSHNVIQGIEREAASYGLAGFVH